MPDRDNAPGHDTVSGHDALAEHDTVFDHHNVSQRAVSPRTRFVARAVVALSVVVIAASIVWLVVDPPAAPQRELATDRPGMSDEYDEGDDPYDTYCADDALLGQAAHQLDGALDVQLFYSTTCAATWAVATWTGGDAVVELTLYRDGDSQDEQTVSGPGTEDLVTPMIVEPDIDVPVCVVASVTMAGAVSEGEAPICL